ncbi:MAG: hypothetical protein EHM67_17020 [Hyphomicrobiaceae bacterium]|nr:MAG: hypothetical protein EHM67_17020 [Hyphomicrobiaceae bacterium]
MALRQAPGTPLRVHFWSGASARRYVHNVYALIDCPPLPPAVYLLVHRQDDGVCKVLHIASALSDAPTLNLARIRHRAATLGANEVHVHLLATSAKQCRTIACDLRAGLFGNLAAEPVESARPKGA